MLVAPGWRLQSDWSISTFTREWEDVLMLSPPALTRAPCDSDRGGGPGELPRPPRQAAVVVVPCPNATPTALFFLLCRMTRDPRRPPLTLDLAGAAVAMETAMDLDLHTYTRTHNIMYVQCYANGKLNHIIMCLVTAHNYHHRLLCLQHKYM